MRPVRYALVVTALSLAAPASLVSCSANMAPIRQPSKRLTRRDGGGITRDEIRDAVERALKRKKWTIEDTGGDFITATVKKGENWARAKITMGPGTYEIRHLESGASFGYTGETIHRRYNRWVERLDAAILQEVSGVYVLDPDESPGDSDDDLKL